MTEKSILPVAWEVPQVFRDRLGARTGRQRSMAADGHLLLILHAPPGPDQTARASRFFWRSPDGNWASNEFGTGVNALNKHLDEYEDKIVKIDRREAEAETSHEYFEILEQLSPLHRSTRNLHYALQEARKTCSDYRELIDARDRAYAIERTADLLFSGTKNSLDILVARQAEEQAKSSRRMVVSAHRLNILAAFFFPIVTLTTIFGANLKHGLENRPSYVFLAVILLGIVLGSLLAAFISRSSES